MSSGPPSSTISDETDTPFDLITAFSHPAGLRVARFVVGTYIRAAQSKLPPPSAETTTHSVPIPTFDTSPEVETLLQTILALSDSEAPRSEGHNARIGDFTMEGHHGNELRVGDYSSAFECSQPGIYSSASQQTPDCFFRTANSLSSKSFQTPHNSSLFSNASQNLLARHYQPDQTSCSLIVNSRSGVPGSLTPGSDSPYRIESPSRTPANNTPQPQTGVASLPALDLFASADLLAARLPPMRKPIPSDSASFSGSTGNSSYSSYSSQISFSTSRNHHATAHLNSSSSDTSITIKSFMPVNKPPESDILVPAKSRSHTDSLYANRPASFEDIASNTPSQQEPTIAQRLAFAPQGINYSTLTQTDEMARTASGSAGQKRKAEPELFVSSKIQKTEQGQDASRKPLNTAGQSLEMERTPSASKGRKRKDEFELGGSLKSQKTEKGAKRVTKSKEDKPQPAAHKLGPDLWMRILEFTPPPFLRKARVLNKDFKTWIDEYTSIFVNQRMEIYGPDMPPAEDIQICLDFSDCEDEAVITPTTTEGEASPDAAGQAHVKKVVVYKKRPQDVISERQYSNLLGGKGCMEKEKEIDGKKVPCEDEKSSRTHWSWAQRWCWSCWKEKIEREDRVIKNRQNLVGRAILLELLACLPNSMHDSFMKPHDYLTEEEARDRSRGAPRLYRYYLSQDVDLIIEEYNKRTPLPYVEDPSLSAAENASAKAVHQIKETALLQKRQDWLDRMKSRNATWLETVRKIEAAVRNRRVVNGKPHEDNREARRQLFTRRAKEELAHIPIEFVQGSEPYKAACRIFRDPGTERGWQTLKPKIQKEFDAAEKNKKSGNEDTENKQNEGVSADSSSKERFEVEATNMRPNTNLNINIGMMSQMQAQIHAHTHAHMRQQFHHQQQQAQFQAQQRSSMHGLPPAQSHHSSFNRHYQLNPQQPNNLSMLATAADLANPSIFASSYNAFGGSNSFQVQPPTHHTNEMFSPMRFDQSNNGGQSGYTQYPSNNPRPMYPTPQHTPQHQPPQEPARTGVSITELLIDPPSNSGRKPTQFHQSY